jgi:hypothetical protein
LISYHWIAKLKRQPVVGTSCDSVQYLIEITEDLPAFVTGGSGETVHEQVLELGEARTSYDTFNLGGIHTDCYHEFIELPPNILLDLNIPIVWVVFSCTMEGCRSISLRTAREYVPSD